MCCQGAKTIHRTLPVDTRHVEERKRGKVGPVAAKVGQDVASRTSKSPRALKHADQMVMIGVRRRNRYMWRPGRWVREEGQPLARHDSRLEALRQCGWAATRVYLRSILVVCEVGVPRYRLGRLIACLACLERLMILPEKPSVYPKLFHSIVAA